MDEKYTITKPKEIRKVLGFSQKIPISYIPSKIEAIGLSTFKGDTLPKKWSINNKFNKGEEYIVYYVPDSVNSMILAIGNDNQGYRMSPKAWTKMRDFK